MDKQSPRSNGGENSHVQKFGISESSKLVQRGPISPEFHLNFEKIKHDDYNLHQKALNLLHSEDSSIGASANIVVDEKKNELQQKLVKAKHKLRKESKGKLQILEELSSLRASLLTFRSSGMSIRKAASSQDNYQTEFESPKKPEKTKKSKKPAPKMKEIPATSQQQQNPSPKKDKIVGPNTSPSEEPNMIPNLNLDRLLLEVGASENNAENPMEYQQHQQQSPSTNQQDLQSSKQDLEIKSKMNLNALKKSKKANRELEKLNKELKKEAKSAIESQQQQIRELEESIFNYENVISALNQQVSNLNNEKLELQTMLERVQEEYEGLMLKNKEIHDSVNSTAKVLAKQKEELVNRVRAEVEELQQALEKQGETAQHREKLLKSQILELQKLNKDLRIKAETLEESLSEQTLRLSVEKTREEKVVDKLRKKLADQESQFETIQRAHQELEVQYNLLKMKCQELEKQKEKNVLNFSQKTDVSNELQLKLAEVENENRNLVFETKTLRSENESLKLANLESQAKLDDCIMKLDAEIQKITRLEDEKEETVSSMTTRIQHLESALSQNEKDLEDQQHQMQSSVNELKDEVMKYKTQLNEKLAENQVLEEELKQARSSLTATIEKTSNLSESSDGLKGHSATLPANPDQQREQNESYRMEICDIRNELEKEKASYGQKINTLNMKITILQNQNEQYSQENAQLFQQTLEDKHKFDTTIRVKTAEIVELNKRIQELVLEKEQLIDAKHKQEELEKTVKQEHGKVEEIQNLTIKFKLQNDHLKENYDKAMKLNAELESMNSSLADQVEELKKSCQRLQEELSALTKENQRLAQKVREEDLKNSQKQIDSAHQISELKQKIKEDEATIKNLKEEHNALKTVVNKETKESHNQLPLPSMQEPDETLRISPQRNHSNLEASQKNSLSLQKTNEKIKKQLTQELHEEVEKVISTQNLHEEQLKPRSEAQILANEEDSSVKDFPQHGYAEKLMSQKHHHAPDNEFRARSALNDHDFKELKNYIERMANELENKSSTVELLKQSLKVHMEKTNYQIEELNRKNEKAQDELRRHFVAIETRLNDQLIAILQEAAQFKQVNLTTKEVGDNRLVLLEIKRILLETLEENAGKKKTKHKGKNEEGSTPTSVELEKKQIKIETLHRIISKMTEEKQEMMKICSQAYRVKTVLTPIKEDQLRDVLKADPSLKALATNEAFIQDAMIYHHFLSEYVLSEPEITLPWPKQNSETNNISRG